MSLNRASTPFPDGRMPKGTHQSPPPPNTNLSLANYETLTAPTKILDAYHLGFRQSFSRHAAFFSWFEKEEICQRGYGLSVALEGATLTAGFYYKRVMSEAGTIRLDICGMYSLSARKSLVLPLLGKTALLESRRCRRDVEAEATVRIMPLPTGECNEPSALTLSRAGFFPRRFFQAQIMGNANDRHLLLSSAGGAYLGMVMHAKPADLRRRSQEALHEWGLLEALR